MRDSTMNLRGLSRSSVLPVLAVLVGTLALTTSHPHSGEDSLSNEKRGWGDLQAFRAFQQFRQLRKSKNDWSRDAGKTEPDLSSSEESDERQLQLIRKSDIDAHQKSTKLVDPPPVNEPALMGRYIVNQAEWTAVATISSRKDVPTFPVANVISVSDGPLGNGTGTPYMYLTPLDYTAIDLAVDPRATLLMTLAQGSYCKDKDMDPMDPRCARILLTGVIKEVTADTPEHEVAKSAVFGRHPWLASMPPDHHFFFAKLKIASIAVLDTFGGPKYVSVEDYFNPPELKDRQTYRRSRDFSYETDNDYSEPIMALRI